MRRILPAYRISREEVATAWGGAQTARSRSCDAFDEDPITMAADAAWQCLRRSASGAEDSARLYFASTSAPYLERLNGSIVAAMCDLDASAFVADFGDSLRAGTSALFAAADRLAADPTMGRAIVVAADCSRSRARIDRRS